MTREARSSSPHGDMVGCFLSLYCEDGMNPRMYASYLAGDVEIFYCQFGMSAISITKAAAAPCHPV